MSRGQKNVVNREGWLELLDAHLLGSSSGRPSKREFLKARENKPASERLLAEWLEFADRRKFVRGKKPIHLTEAGLDRLEVAMSEYATSAAAERVLDLLDKLSGQITGDYSNAQSVMWALVIKATNTGASMLGPALERTIFLRVAWLLDERPLYRRALAFLPVPGV